MAEIFKNISKIEYEGADSKNPLAFKFYDADKIVFGKKMSEHLPFAMAWWHNLCAEGGDMWHTLAEIAERADIITFHTPLTKEGPDATYRLADEKFFNFLRRAPIIINTARGAVVDNDAWVRAINAGVAGKAVVDCWEGEPNINLDLLRLSAIATPHIAGYSFEGKQRASQMALDAVCRHLGLPSLKVSGPAPKSVARASPRRGAHDSYNPLDDTAALRSAADTAPAFEALRNGYKLRPELDEKFSN